MSLRRLICEIDVSSVNVRAFCVEHGISKSFFYALRARAARGEGLEARSRAARQVRNRTPDGVINQIIELRKELTDLGVDNGPATIRYHLARRVAPGTTVPSEATIWRHLRDRGFVVASPQKRPDRVQRFAAERVNECWQIDATSWTLPDGKVVEIIDVIDDCSRVYVHSAVVDSCTAPAAFATLAAGAAEWGWPQRILRDNAKAFDALSEPLAALGIANTHSRPFHPQTCGKVERLHRTVKQHLDVTAPADVIELHAVLDRFRRYYNQQRPHRAVGRRTPAEVFATTPRSGPANAPLAAPGTTQTWTTLVTRTGIVSAGRYRISVGTAHAGDTATTVITGTRAHVFVNARLVRAFTLDPTRQRQTLHLRPGRPPKP